MPESPRDSAVGVDAKRVQVQLACLGRVAPDVSAGSTAPDHALRWSSRRARGRGFIGRTHRKRLPYALPDLYRFSFYKLLARASPPIRLRFASQTLLFLCASSFSSDLSAVIV